MTDSATSPFVLLRTVAGLVSVDVRMIAGTVTRQLDRRVYVSSTVGDSSSLCFASDELADAAVEKLHAAREQHDDARAEDARAKVVGEAIRESGREFTQQIADVLASTLAAGDAFRKLGTPPPGGCLFDAEAIIEYDLGREHPASEAIHACIRQIADKPHRTPLYLADLLASSRTPEPVALDVETLRADHVEATRKFLADNGYVTRKIDVKANGLVQLHLTCGAIVCLYTTTGTAVVQGKPSDADRKAIIELLLIDEWKV